MKSHILDIIGNILLILASVLVLVGYIGIIIFQGWSRLLDVLGPFNIINFLTILLAFTPGLVFKILASKRHSTKAKSKY